MKLQLTQKLSQQLALSQQLVQAIELMQLPTIELEQTVKQFLEVNPFVELEEPTIDEDQENFSEHYGHYDIVKSAHSSYDFELINNIPEKETLRNHLMAQLLNHKMNKRFLSIAESIIDEIDDNGFLTTSIEDIYQRAGGEYANITLEDIHQILATIQTFTPEGVGARNIQESLIIQLNFKSSNPKMIEIAKHILNDYFVELTQRQFKLIAKKLRLSMAELKEAMAVIKQLTPMPGSQFSDNVLLKSDPEVFVFKKNEKWHVALTKSSMTHLKVNHHYGEMLKSARGSSSLDLAKSQYQEAQWLHRAISRRNETLLKISEYILKKQVDFFNFGKAHLKPLNIIDIASELGIHESTVSRATNGKFIMTPHGVFELTFFLPSYVKTKTGETCSAVQVKTMIDDIIHTEDSKSPLSDDAITQILSAKGINISRRTVAKYREDMQILPSYQRVTDF